MARRASQEPPRRVEIIVNLLGYSAQEISGRHALDFVHPDFRDHARAILESGLVTRVETSLRQKNGGRIWAITSINGLFDAVASGAERSRWLPT